MVTAAALAGTPTLGNYPDTSLPLSTNTTVTPDSPPTNTTSVTVSTSTDFLGTFVGDPSTGVVRVTDPRPAGTYTIMVRAFNGAGLTVTKTFTLTVTTPRTCTPVNFAAATAFSAGGYTPSVAVGDFNGDGQLDLAVANAGLTFGGWRDPHYIPGNVSILLGDGTGNFGPPSSYLSGHFSSVAVGDFNGDGKQDLAVTYGLSYVSILLGDGAGSFSAPVNFGTGSNPSAVAVGDFNGDGKQDLAVANKNSHNVSILLGDGTGNFSAATNFGVGYGPASVAVGDFNRDGNQDLAVAYQGRVSILLGNGTGDFSAATDFGVNVGPLSVAVSDFNSDGKQDLAVTVGDGSNNVAILLGDGTGHFSAGTNFGAGTYPYSVVVGDFDGDGKQDLAVANLTPSYTVSILLGDSAGHFGAATNFFGLGVGPRSVAVGDFDRDGEQDLAVADTYGVSILLRICGPIPAQPRNLSTRLRVLTDGNVGVGGLIITGSVPKRVVLRGIGPSLANFNVPNPLADPVLELHGPTGFTTITNDNWMDAPNHQQIQDLGLAPSDNLESAILATLSPGNYTGILEGNNNGVGVGLVEIWDVDQAAGSKLGNISTRGFVATGDDIMIAGLILNGNTAQDIVLRGIGPSLTAFGVPNALANPTLELRDSNGTLIRANDDWQDDEAQAALINAAGLAPTNVLESAIAATLPPGPYTALLAGLNNGTGVGLVEVYDSGTP